MKQMTFKEFFERAKNHEGMQRLIVQCFITATKMVIKTGTNADIGILVLNALSTMAEMFHDVQLTGREELTGEYMAEIVNMYSANLAKTQ